MADDKQNRIDPGNGYFPPDKDLMRINGDPGIGGILADPELPKQPDRHRVRNNTPSPDPEEPKAHGDWAPNRKWREKTSG